MSHNALQTLSKVRFVLDDFLYVAIFTTLSTSVFGTLDYQIIPVPTPIFIITGIIGVALLAITVFMLLKRQSHLERENVQHRASNKDLQKQVSDLRDRVTSYETQEQYLDKIHELQQELTRKSIAIHDAYYQINELQRENEEDDKSPPG